MAPPGETQASVAESAQPLMSATTSTGAPTGVTLTANGTDTPLATRNVGIVAMEMYFPSTYIEQTELGTGRDRIANIFRVQGTNQRLVTVQGRWRPCVI